MLKTSSRDNLYFDTKYANFNIISFFCASQLSGRLLVDVVDRITRPNLLHRSFSQDLLILNSPDSTLWYSPHISIVPATTGRRLAELTMYVSDRQNSNTTSSTLVSVVFDKIVGFPRCFPVVSPTFRKPKKVDLVSLLYLPRYLG